MNDVTNRAAWVYKCRVSSTSQIDPVDFVIYEEIICIWENRLFKKDPVIAGNIIARAFKIYLYDQT